jgi:predicted NAD-dependent protein-ADP-ribosyltransferase YbiA (DUF1768 family)
MPGSYMMHHKALLFGDEPMALEILKASNPRKAKSLGRRVSNFDEKLWNEHRERIVRHGNYLKFTKDVSKDGIRRGNYDSSPLVGSSLRDLLLNTGDCELVEASPFDRVWGVGFTAEDADRTKRSLWGSNLLGKALMEVRGMLRREDDKTAEGGSSS